MRPPLLKHDPSAPATLVPDLGDLDYRVQGLLATDSKMSEILLATDRKGQTVVFKIAGVQQRVRAETNRRAIHNSVLWLQQMRDHAGIAQLQPIRYKSQRGPRSWFAPPIFVTTLPAWPGQPDFLISEYLAGGTLSSFVGKRPLPVDLALTLTYALAQTVAYLHERQCVHRDLKPENVLFRTPPALTAPPDALQPVLIDFGVAARTGEAKLISGSRLWMAPELQTAHEKNPLPVDPAWDVYALGLICCYMLSGRRPIRRQHDYQDYVDYRDQLFAFLHQEAAGADAAWQQVVAALQKLLTRTLDRDPLRRPTAAAFRNALGTILLSMGITPPPAPIRPARVYGMAWPKLRYRWRWLGLVAVCILGFLFLSRILGGQAASPPPAARPAMVRADTTATLVIIHATAAVSPAKMSSQMVQPKHTVPPPTATIPPPTLAPLPTIPTDAIPTLAVIHLTEQVAPPTARPQPTAFAFATIRLLAPQPNVIAAQEQVVFSWEAPGTVLALDHCYELVFWDPAQSDDKWSPVGAGRAAKGTVNFRQLSDSPDPRLYALTHSPQGFAWGVRFVSCTSPKTVLQDVQEVRHYTYQP